MAISGIARTKNISRSARSKSKKNTEQAITLKKAHKQKISGIVKPCEKTKEDDEEKLKRDHHWYVQR